MAQVSLMIWVGILVHIGTASIFIRTSTKLVYNGMGERQFAGRNEFPKTFSPVLNPIPLQPACKALLSRAVSNWVNHFGLLYLDYLFSPV